MMDIRSGMPMLGKIHMDEMLREADASRLGRLHRSTGRNGLRVTLGDALIRTGLLLKGDGLADSE